MFEDFRVKAAALRLFLSLVALCCYYSLFLLLLLCAAQVDVVHALAREQLANKLDRAAVAAARAFATCSAATTETFFPLSLPPSFSFFVYELCID